MMYDNMKNEVNTNEKTGKLVTLEYSHVSQSREHMT